MNTTIIRCSVLLTFLLAIASKFAFSQSKILAEQVPDIEWSQGSVVLNSGKELKGMVKFNDRNGIVSVEHAGQSGSYTARSVSSFEFFDDSVARPRNFFSLEFADSNAPAPVFFEILKDFKTFAVLLKADRIKMRRETRGRVGSNLTITDVKIIDFVEQSETVYFMDAEGKIEPYLTILRKLKVVDDDTEGKENKKSRWIDSDVPKKYFSPQQLETMQQYAEANNLKFNLKEDLLKILNAVH